MIEGQRDSAHDNAHDNRHVSERKCVLVTGALGNLGQLVIHTFKARGYRVLPMDLETPANRKTAQRLGYAQDMLWGDIRKVDFVPLLPRVSAVVHLAALLPPVTESAPALAEAVNLTSTLRLIEALEACAVPPLLIYPSSVTVFGYPSDTHLKSVADAPKPSDNYTRQKVQVEQRLAHSPIPWCVLRVGVSVDARTLGTELDMVRRLFSVSPDNPLEYVHPADVAEAIVNCLDNPAALRGIWLIGGGASCRVTQHEFLSVALNAIGVALPKDMLGTEAFYTHWMDTAESQRVLRFQNHGFDSYRREMAQRLGWLRPLVRPFAPLVRWGMRRVLK